MKLATLRDGSRDGRLAIIDRKLARGVDASAVAATMQAALDGWDTVSPRLRQLSDDLDRGKAPDAFAFDPAALMAPLPRCYGFIDSSVYLNHMELARALRGATLPETYRREPLISLRLPAPFLGPCADAVLPDGDVGLDMEAEVAVILDDVPPGSGLAEAASHIRLVTLVNDTSYRTVLARELGEGRAAYLGKGAPSMAPVAVTPDELGSDWRNGMLARPIEVRVNGELLGKPNAAVDASFTFPDIIRHACRYRGLCAGTVIAAGTVSNRDPGAGSACIAERRMIETRDRGEAKTPYLAAADAFRIEMSDGEGRSIFGTIEQRVVDRSAAAARHP
jgi:fumarylacetoacetate (FAA) hydrolase